MTNLIGIDLDTSTTSSAVVRDEKPVMIPGAGISPVVPSYVHLRDDGKILIGESAKAEAIADPYNTIWATKRLWGRRFNEPGIRECAEKLCYTILGEEDGGISIKARDKRFPPEWAGSLLINLMARQASEFLGSPVKRAVFTVPGTFNQSQRDAVTGAARKVGIEAARLLNEPTAAALSWGYKQDCDQTVAVFDFGGGTFDVAVLKIGGGGFKILSAKGHPWLGGEDADNLLVEHLAKDFRRRYKLNIYSDKIAHQRVKTGEFAIKASIKNDGGPRPRVAYAIDKKAPFAANAPGMKK